MPTFAAVDAHRYRGAAKACTQLTEDDKVFVVMGFFQAADVDCYTSLHGVPIIGASLRLRRQRPAKAAWYNDIISDSDLIPKEMAHLLQGRSVQGQEVAVVDEAADAADMNLVGCTEEAEGDVVQTATNSAPRHRRSRLRSQYQHHRREVPVGPGRTGSLRWQCGERMASRAAGQPEHLSASGWSSPTYIDLDAYVDNKAGDSRRILKNAITAGAIRPAAVVWNDPAMKKCVAAIQAKEPKAKINNPVTATASTPVTWTAPRSPASRLLSSPTSSMQPART